MDSLNRWIVESMLALHPSIFYEKGFQVAAALLGVVGGLILVLSFVLRIAQEFGSPEPPRWMPVINDFIKSGAMLALYFAAWGMAVSLFNALYALFEDSGSIQSVFNSYAEIFSDYKANIERTAKEDSTFSFGSFIGGGVDAVGTYFGEVASYLFFTLSTLCVMLAYAITKLFHGLLFALAIIWGALVWSVRPIVNLIRGWLLLTGLVLVWPLMESLIFLFLDLTIRDALTSLIPRAGTQHEFGLVALEVVLGVLNIIMGFVLVAIPIITSRLLANSDLSMELASALTTTVSESQKAVYEGVKKTAGEVLGLTSRTSTGNSGSPKKSPLRVPPKTPASPTTASSSTRSSDTSASPSSSPDRQNSKLSAVSFSASHSHDAPAAISGPRQSKPTSEPFGQTANSPSRTPAQSGLSSHPSGADLQGKQSKPTTAPSAQTANSPSRTSAQSGSSSHPSGADLQGKQSKPTTAPSSQTTSVPPTDSAPALTSTSSRPSHAGQQGGEQHTPHQSDNKPNKTPMSGDGNADSASTTNTKSKSKYWPGTKSSATSPERSRNSEIQARRDALVETLKQRSKGRKR